MNNQSPVIYVLFCSTSFEAADLTAPWRGQVDAVKTVPLPCSGRIDILYLTKAFELGADGLAIVVCKQGECRYLEGNLRARKRAEAVDALLGETGLGKGRVAVIQMDDGGVEKVVRELADFCNRITALPRALHTAVRVL